MRDPYDDDTVDWIPDPETPYNCDVCGKVLLRGHKGWLCDRCDLELGELKKSKEWKERSRTYTGLAEAMAQQWGGNERE